MRRLVFNGKAFAFVDGPDPVAPQLLDVPRRPQKVRTVRPERLTVLRPMHNRGNGYRPGPLLDLGPDQCRYTIRDGVMCGAKCGRHPSWCDHHAAVCFAGQITWNSKQWNRLAGGAR